MTFDCAPLDRRATVVRFGQRNSVGARTAGFATISTRVLAAALVLALVLLTSACDSTSPTTSEPAQSVGDSGQIQCASPVFDFGAADNTAVVKHDFILKNAGKLPLRIFSVQTTCGCTVAELPKDLKVLQPMQEVPLSVAFDSRGKKGPQHKEIRVNSSDPESPVFLLTIQGTVIEPIRIEPSRANFGKIADDAIHTQDIVLEAVKEGLLFNVVQASTSSPSFTASVTTIETGKKHRIQVSTQEALPPGKYTGEVILVTDNEAYKELRIKIFATAAAHVVVTPPSLAMRSTDGPGSRVSRILKVSPGRGGEFQITEVVVPLDEIAVKVNDLGNSLYEISLENIPATPDLNGKEVLIRTNNAHAPELRVGIKVLRPMPSPPAVDG